MAADGGNSFREIVRQQWNFSPPETIREVAEYQVELASATTLELIIVPKVAEALAPRSRVCACLDRDHISRIQKRNCPAREFSRRAVC
jgi:hypothetical protein